MRVRHLPQKLKFWKKIGNITVSEQYFINWKLFTKSMPLFKKSILKIRFNKKQTESSKRKTDFFPVTLNASFLTLTQIILNFKCYRKDWNVNNSMKKYNLYNTKFQIKNRKVDNGLNEAVIRDNWFKLMVNDFLYETFLETIETPVHFIYFLDSLSSRDYSFSFICSCKMAFCLGASTQYQHLTTKKWTHPRRFNKNHIRM